MTNFNLDWIRISIHYLSLLACKLHVNGFYLQLRSGDITRKEFNAYVVKNMSQTDEMFSCRWLHNIAPHAPEFDAYMRYYQFLFGPGIFLSSPCMDSIVYTDLRTVSFDVPPQEILTKDSVTVAVDAVVYYRV